MTPRTGTARCAACQTAGAPECHHYSSDLAQVTPYDELPEWTPIIDGATCHRCQAAARAGWGYIIGEGTETHYAKLVCADCGGHIRWLPGPDAKPKRDHNRQARHDWAIRLGGQLICALCGITEAETRADFHMHHTHRIEDGGDAHASDATIPLCMDCHQIAEALRAHQRHCRGLSARTSAA